MSIDYSAAAELGEVVRAFAIIESNEDEAQVGDGGQAFGLLQMHPAAFKRFYGALGRFAQNVRDTWTTAQIKACAAFLAAHRWGSVSQDERDLIVQAWNLGEAGVFLREQRNPEYLARWREAYGKVREGE